MTLPGDSKVFVPKLLRIDHGGNCMLHTALSKIPTMCTRHGQCFLQNNPKLEIMAVCEIVMKFTKRISVDVWAGCHDCVS